MNRTTSLEINKCYEALRGFEGMSSNEIRLFIEKQKASIFEHSKQCVPYYRDLFLKHNIRTVADWSRIPILTKREIRSEASDLIDSVNRYEKVRKNTSGGSTGEPVEFLQDENYKLHRLAMKRLYDSWSGYSAGESKVIIWGSERDILMGAEDWRTRVRRWLKNEVWINAFRMSDASMMEAVRTINRRKPVQILAYVEAISTLCKFIRKHNLKVHSPVGIMTSAGTLYPEIKKEIEEVFRTPVFNRYGSRELGDMGSMRSSTSALYAHPAVHYIEILNEDGQPCAPREAGKIVVTSFTNKVMPLLRYEIGDIGVIGSDLGDSVLPFQSLSAVKGRVSDTFVGMDGAQVHGEYFTHLLYHRAWAEKFQFHQRKDGSVDVMLQIPEGNTFAQSGSERLSIDRDIRKVLGAACVIRWAQVDNISEHENGKYRYVISDIKQ